MMLKGVFTAVVTPFQKDEQLDEEGLRQNLRFQIREGVDGIVILGTTGESSTIEPDEKRRIIKIAVEEIKGKALLLVGTGNYSTRQTISNTLQAKELGADAALIITPYYNKPTQEGLFLHYQAISQATTLPICLYTNPGRTGVNLQTETLKRLAAIPTIIGVKDCTTIGQLSDIVDSIHTSYPHFAILTGDDPLALAALSLGCHGLISVVSNLVPGVIKKLVSAGLKGNFEEARKLHSQLMPFYHAAFIESNPIPIKAAMNYCGMAAGHCRLPLCDLLPGNQTKLNELIKKLPQEWFAGYGQS